MKGNKMIKYMFLFLVLVFQLKWIWAQNSSPDSLQNVSYNYLEEKSDTALSDSLKKFYAQAYLTKAKKNKDTIRIAEGFNLMSVAYSHTLFGITFADSAIEYTKNVSHHKYPAGGYLQKGIQLYYNSEYELALENFIITEKKAKLQNNILQQVSVKHYIGLLKNVNNEKEEALNYFRENVEFIKDNNLQTVDRKQYLKSLYALAESYNRNNILDSADIICRTGIVESLKTRDNYLYPFFLISYGVTKTHKGEYDIALDSLIKGSKIISNEKKVLCNSYLIISTVYLEKQQRKLSLKYLIKIDSVYKKYPQVIMIAKDAYEMMLRHYLYEEGNENQLTTIKKLLEVDSIITIKYSNLSKRIVQKYEAPLLLSEKEKVIEKLEQKEGSNKVIKVSLYLFIIFLLFIIFYFYRKNSLNKKRFKAFLEEYNSKENLSETKNTDLEKAKSLDLSEELVKNTLNKLDGFERSHKFTKQQYTLNKLAKELGTNSSYLSKIINATKNQNFANYFNNLRIDYAIDQLTKNKKLRLYTIQAIAEEAGFKSAQSFSTAFYKKTGIYPSFFIKQLNKQKINVND